MLVFKIYDLSLRVGNTLTDGSNGPNEGSNLVLRVGFPPLTCATITL